MKRLLPNRTALAFAVVGVALLAVAHHFNLNPVCGGAVRGGLQDHPWLLLSLAVATMPAICVGIMALGVFPGTVDQSSVYFTASFACQLLLYLGVGSAVSWIARSVKKIARKHQQSLRADAELRASSANRSMKGEKG